MRKNSGGNRIDTYRVRRGAGGSPAGFSLIELLVVIAIVAVITVMLAPAVQQDLAQGEQVVCANNWRQVYMIAYTFYSDNGRWPVGFGITELHPQLHWWFQELFPNVAVGLNETGWGWGPLAPGAEFEVDPRILDCPSNLRMWPWNGTPTSWAYWTTVNAAPNAVGRPNDDNPGQYPVDLPENPELWPWIVDGAMIWWGKGHINNYAGGVIDIPHREGTNIAFYDGHVAWSPLEDLPAVLFDNWIDL